MAIIKFILSFLIGGLFNEPDEYNFRSKKFKIVKILFVAMFLLSLFYGLFISLQFYSLAVKHIKMLENAAVLVEHKQTPEECAAPK